MYPQTAKVLTALRQSKSKGISFHSVMWSRSLPKRVCELIEMGYSIARISERTEGYNYKRYVLTGEPK
jgi:type II secretory pathway component PulF